MTKVVDVRGAKLGLDLQVTLWNGVAEMRF